MEMNAAVFATLQRLDALFDHELLTVTEAAAFLGVSREKAARDLDFCPATKRISKASLAMQINERPKAQERKASSVMESKNSCRRGSYNTRMRKV